MNKKAKFGSFAACIYAVFQIVLLFFLRKLYLLTVYQTVAFYGAISLAGIALLCISRYLLRKEEQKQEAGKGCRIWIALRDSYLVFWSGIHGAIVLGFMTCGTFYLTLTQVTVVQIVNLFLGVALFWVFYILSGKAVTAVGLGNLVIGIMGTANYYLVKFRGAPFQLSDIKAARTAANVVGNYDFTPSLLLIVAILDLVIWYFVWRLALKEENGKTALKCKRWNPVSIAGTVVVAAGCVTLQVCDFGKVYAETQQFTQDTYLATLLAEVMGSSNALPEGYSEDTVTDIVNRFSGTVGDNLEAAETLSGSKPHIVVIMNEAFSDLRVLGSFETTEPVLEFWDSLDENVIRGWANVSVLGGNTANSEYEFLTSDSLGAFPGTIPYNRYFHSEDAYPGMVSVLKEQGYETTAFHPYYASGWNRTQVYRSMQFDRIVFLDNLEQELDTVRRYVSDEADYGYIIDYFEQNKGGKPQMFFNITMQNHGGYAFDNDEFPATVQLAGDARGRFPQAEQYLTLMKASDEALEGLLDYFSEYEEPVIVVLFGDHQPRLEDGFYEYVTGQPVGAWDPEQRMNQYKTPFIIWHNYETESYDAGDISLNYLAALTMQSAGLSLSDYQQYVLRQYEQLPVVSSIGIRTADGQLFAAGSNEYAECIREYRMLVYNHTVDREGRLEEFYR